MLNTKTVLILGLLTAAAIAAALLGRPDSADVSGGGLLFPALMPQVNDVSRIEVRGQGASFTLLQQAGQWRMPDKHDHPASMDQVRALLLGMAGLKRIEPKTRNPEHYASLGVQDIDELGAQSVQVTLKDRSGQPLAALIIGKQRQSAGAGWYVRLPDDAQSWLVSGGLPAQWIPNDWLEQRIAGIATERVQRVRIQHADGERIEVYRDDAQTADFQLADIPADSMLRSPYGVNMIGAAFAELQFTDVIPTAQATLDTAPDYTVEAITFDGLRVTLEVFKHGEDQHHLRLQARFDASVRGSALPSSPERSAEAISKEAAALDARWRQWIYVLPPHRLINVDKLWGDLVMQAPAG